MSRFPTTRWSLIQSASREIATGSRESVGRLLDQYWQPMFVHLRHRGVSNENAEDLIQDFAIEILKNDLLSYADAGRGKFRTLLLTALDRFVISKHRYQSAAKRSPGRVASLDAIEGQNPASDASDPGLVFDRAWGIDVLAETLARMRRECTDDSQSVRWDVFEQRVLRALLDDEEPTSFAQLMTTHALASEKAAMNMLVTAKRQFSRHLRDVVREYVTRSGGVRADGTARELPMGADGLVDEHAISHAVAREIEDLQVMLARSRSARELVPEAACEFTHKDPWKSFFWRRLTAGLQATDGDLGAMFGVGTEPQNGTEGTLEDLFRDTLATNVAQLIPRLGPDIRTLHESLLGDTADLPGIRQIKDWANLHRFSGDRSLPRPLASGIYFVTLAIAEVRWSERITGLQPTELLAGLQWAAEQPWMPEEYRQLLGQASRSIDPKLPAQTGPSSRLPN